MKREIWKPIAGYEGLYEVSNNGNVRIVDYRGTGKWRILKPRVSNCGYLQIGLCKYGEQKTFLIHRIVAQSFVPNPLHLPCVNHKDENKLNNSVENLEWCTHKYNNNYGSGKLREIESKNKKGSVNAEKALAQINRDGDIVKTYKSASFAGKLTGVNPSNITESCRLFGHQAGGFFWMYLSDANFDLKLDDIRTGRVAFTFHKRPIIRINMDGIISGEFATIKDAADSVCGHHANIIKCCRGEIKTAYGYRWKYA